MSFYIHNKSIAKIAKRCVNATLASRTSKSISRPINKYLLPYYWKVNRTPCINENIKNASPGMRLTFGPRTRLTGPLLDRYDFYAYDKRCHVYAGAYVVGLASRSTNQRGLGMTLLSLSFLLLRVSFRRRTSLDIFCRGSERQKQVKAEAPHHREFQLVTEQLVPWWGWDTVPSSCPRSWPGVFLRARRTYVSVRPRASLTSDHNARHRYAIPFASTTLSLCLWLLSISITLWLPRRNHTFRWGRHGSIFIIQSI